MHHSPHGHRQVTQSSKYVDPSQQRGQDNRHAKFFSKQWATPLIAEGKKKEKIFLTAVLQPYIC